MLLGETLPELADELAALLRQKRRPDLADQAPYLSIVDRCRCGMSSASRFIHTPNLKVNPVRSMNVWIWTQPKECC
jgi:hypothetical protein